MLLGEMVKAGQVVNPSYGKYDLPSTNPYSPYSANSDGGKEGESKESKRSKGTVEAAYSHPESGTVISLRKAPNAHNQSGDSLDELSAFLANPPGWYTTQARECAREGTPERLLKPLAYAVAHEVLGNTNRWSEVLPHLEVVLREERP